MQILCPRCCSSLTRSVYMPRSLSEFIRLIVRNNMFISFLCSYLVIRHVRLVHHTASTVSKSEFSPDHFVDYAGVALDELDDLGGDAFVDVVGHGEAEVAVAVHLYSHVHGLEE